MKPNDAPCRSPDRPRRGLRVEHSTLPITGWPPPAHGRRSSSDCTFAARSSACRWSRSSSARRPRTPRWRGPSTSCARSQDADRRHDRRGFYTSRVFACYVLEGVRCCSTACTRAASRPRGLQAGMPMPPLALQDEVSLSLALHVADRRGATWPPTARVRRAHPASRCCANCARLAGRGARRTRLYDWDERRRLGRGQRQAAVAGSDAAVPHSPRATDATRLDRPAALRQANEAARCWQEGVCARRPKPTSAASLDGVSRPFTAARCAISTASARGVHARRANCGAPRRTLCAGGGGGAQAASGGQFGDER